MHKKQLSLFTVFIVSVLILTGCNLPDRRVISTQTPAQPAETQLPSSPTPVPACTNSYFPNAMGDEWEYSGTNSISGAYTRTDTITNSNPDSFTQETSIAGITYAVAYDCTATGLVSRNPIQQYAGMLLSSPNAPVEVKLSSNTGISLPSKINPGDTWQQTSDWKATSPQLNLSGRFVFDYVATGYENITIAAGSYNALQVVATIHIELSGLHIQAGTYTSTLWFVPEIGLVKSEGTSQVPGIDFTDSMQLTSFIPAR